MSREGAIEDPFNGALRLFDGRLLQGRLLALPSTSKTLFHRLQTRLPRRTHGDCQTQLGASTGKRGGNRWLDGQADEMQHGAE
jgi:hypothetical protein